MHNDSHSTPKPSHEEWLPKSRCSTAPTSKIAPPQAPIMHFQLCSPIRISVYRYALTVFGQGRQSNCYNDIAFAKKRACESCGEEEKMSWKGERGAAATHREPLRTHSMSGLALSRRHQGHCNEIQGRRGEGKRGRRGRTRKMRASKQRLVMVKSGGHCTGQIFHIDQKCLKTCTCK